jgi:virulence factor Mce-like protein
MNLVKISRWLRRHTLTLSTIGLVVLVLLGGSYLLLDIMRINPIRDTYTVTVEMDRSGGLQPNNDVTLRGYRVGKVVSLSLTGTGVAAKARIDSRYRIPRGGSVAVRALSAAGEQYLDFRPDRDEGPYLSDGSVINTGVTTPTQVSDLLSNASSLIDQIDPKKMNVVITELDRALIGGPDQLRSIVTGLSVGTAGLDRLLPQTTNLVANLRSIASTTSLAQPDLGTLTRNSTIIFQQANRADAELRRFLDNSSGQMKIITDVTSSTTDPLTRVAKDFVAITKAAQLRTPALAALFPSLRDGVHALGIPAHDGYFNTIIDIYPTPVCEYKAVPNPVAVIPNQGRVRLWNYCTNVNPELQVRGSANAPRPDVPNNGAQMPPGVDPNQMSMPNPDQSTW